MIFPIVWILLFVDGVYAAAILPITVGMIHLSLARFQKTSPEFGDPVSRADIDVKRVELMIDTLSGLGKIELITFDVVRRPDKQPEIF